MVARLLNYSHFKVETAKLLKEDRTKKSGLSSNCLFLVVIDFDFLDPSYIIADGIFLQGAPQELTEYDELMVRKYIDQIKICEDYFMVCFKAKVEIDIQR